MAVQTDDMIVKQELINTFKENLLNAMYTNNLKSKESPAWFVTESGSVVALGYAIPIDHLDTGIKPTPNIEPTMITAKETYDALKNIVDKLTRIRYYTSYRYYQTNDTLALTHQQSGIAIFKESIGGLASYNKNVKQNGYSGWDRNINGVINTGSTIRMTTILNVVNPFIVNNEIQANQVQPYTLNASLFNNLFKAWEVERNKRVTYTLYSCHSNCHNNWINTRRRR